MFLCVKTLISLIYWIQALRRDTILGFRVRKVFGRVPLPQDPKQLGHSRIVLELLGELAESRKRLGQVAAEDVQQDRSKVLDGHVGETALDEHAAAFDKLEHFEETDLVEVVAFDVSGRVAHLDEAAMDRLLLGLVDLEKDFAQVTTDLGDLKFLSIFSVYFLCQFSSS